METKDLTLKFDKYENQLMPVIVQDKNTGQILMQAFANPDALKATGEKGLATFWSRSQNKIWTKGETSGNSLKIEEIRTDCDNDCLIYLVDSQGNAACDTGRKSCFYKIVDPIALEVQNNTDKLLTWENIFLEEEAMIKSKWSADPDKSATAFALNGSIGRAAQKFGEESIEVVCAVLDDEQGRDKIILESADLLYRMQILLQKSGIAWEEIETEIINRRK